MNQYSEIHKEIIEKCKSGSSRAQYKLYTLYSKAMFNICNRMLNSIEEAEDLLQESFTEAFLKLDSFRYESSFGAWLKRITINKCINSLKKKKADLVYCEEYQNVGYELEERNEDFPYTVENVHQAMRKLSDGYRVVFSLYLLEGYDHTEISQILGISESTSKTQFLRAKRKIKELIQLQLN